MRNSDSICYICEYMQVIEQTKDSPREEWCDEAFENFGTPDGCRWFKEAEWEDEE